MKYPRKVFRMATDMLREGVFGKDTFDPCALSCLPPNSVRS